MCFCACLCACVLALEVKESETDVKIIGHPVEIMFSTGMKLSRKKLQSCVYDRPPLHQVWCVAGTRSL